MHLNCSVVCLFLFTLVTYAISSSSSWLMFLSVRCKSLNVTACFFVVFRFSKAIQQALLGPLVDTAHRAWLHTSMHACFVASVCCFIYLWKYDIKCLIVPRLQMLKNLSWIGFSSKTYRVNLLTETSKKSKKVGFQMFRDFYLFNNRGSFMNTWHWLWRHKAPSAPRAGFSRCWQPRPSMQGIFHHHFRFSMNIMSHIHGWMP